MLTYTAIKPLVATLGLMTALTASVYADTAKFTLHKAMDTSDPSHLAISYLIPAGWKATDSINWDIHQRMAPLVISTVATSPDDRFVVRWLNPVAMNYVHQGGPADKGTPPPEHPADLLIETFKKTHPGVEPEVVERQETPATSIFQSNNITESRAFDCAVKLRYVVKGVPTLTKSGFHFDGYDSRRFASGLWTLRNITSITGPEAEFPKAMKLGAVVLSSRQWDPQFFQQYQEICLTIVNQIQKEGKAYLDAKFAAMRKEYHPLSGTNKEAFEEQMAAKDKSTRQFCDYVLDRQRYTDGHTEFIMPSGYTHAVTDGSSITMTDDTNFASRNGYQELRKLP